ncbi:MAG: ArsA-related P-loop ATPase [Pseudomonadales bacterium]|jgi:anion-transporting  ArsA/GET3 family ATPase|nr:ArsA-related P-loop ATPase [Pseudomonadales bacterium]MDP6472775.1 ArsA-related P-loop ATPase [Pseudomonadales bacterium]MDP6827988.1 ArsA-related P-loop ATPase [Pseudomonadales bacterium]MDP6972887.1 ArsA-related P-loop ATPase [Pseudomonadales bacterium]|tara:strand:- start:270 stop:1355 length:1086 start_codon:yes stop_codon:yes gene_type:complete
MSGLEAVLRDQRIVLCGGSGGVGKTTTAAALGLLGASLGLETLILTIDPARRLANAMGLEHIEPHPQRLPEAPNLSVMMLDAGQTFDALVARHAKTEDSAKAFLANPYYQQISATVAGSREFMAMEQIHELAQDEQFQLVIVDTPPTQHALDFLNAPKRLIELLDGTGLGMVIRASSFANRMSFGMLGHTQNQFARFFEALTGHRLMLDLNDFFETFADVIQSFKKRAASLQALLRSEDAAFLLVLTPAEELAEGTERYLARLTEEQMTVRGIVFNQVHEIQSCPVSAEVLRAGEAEGLPRELVRRALECHAHWFASSENEARLIAPWHERGLTCVRVPRLPGNIASLDELRRISSALATA